MSVESPVRVMLVDRHALLVAGVRCALESARDITVVGEARSDVHALALIGRVRPDVLLIDPLTSCAAGMAGIAGIRACHPEVAVVAMSDSTDPADIDQALGNGAAVFVVKSIRPDDLPSTIRQVVNGTVHHVRPQPAEAPLDAGMAELSARELSIVSLAADGLSNSEIGRRLHLSDHSVKHYLRLVYRKLGVTSRTGAASVAYRRRILEPASGSRLSVGA
jgi:DNA-binding NarL/FixJ family response regulator